MRGHGLYQSLYRSSLFRPTTFAQVRARQTAPKSRSFHASKPCHMIDESILLAHDFLQGFHSLTGLPWVASIPAAAVAVRLSVALPLQVWSLLNGQRMQRLNPLLITWGRVHQKQILDNNAADGRISLSPRTAEAMSKGALKKTRKALYKRWKVYPWASYITILQLPVWLTMMESLRIMVGFNRGLLSIIQSWFESAGDSLLAIPIERSMSVEGALWFPDLLVADPTHALPLILSATMFTNITWGWKVKSAAEISKMGRTEAIRARTWKGLKRVLQGLSLWLTPVMIYSQAPAGLLIYWISSSFFATAQTQTLRKVMRGTPPPDPCSEKGVGSIYDKDTSKSK